MSLCHKLLSLGSLYKSLNNVLSLPMTSGSLSPGYLGGSFGTGVTLSEGSYDKKLVRPKYTGF